MTETSNKLVTPSDLKASHELITEQLVRSEERFRLLVEGVQDYAIYMLDPTGIVISWNSGAQRIKGYRAEEIIGKNFLQFFRPEDRAAWRRGHPHHDSEHLRLGPAPGRDRARAGLHAAV